MSGPGQVAGKPGRGGISPGARFVMLAALSLVLIIVDHRYDHLSRARELLTVAVYPIQVAVDFPFSAWQWAADAVADRRDLLTENEELRQQLLIAEYRLQNLNSLAMENVRLRQLLDSHDELNEGRVLIAEILSVDLDPYPSRFIINRGLADDVYVGQPLLDADGVIGQVEAVSPTTAEALFITEPDHAIPVTIERTGERTLAEGTGVGRMLRLPYVTNSADVRPGDRLVTSGLGRIFPAGRPVAVIEEFVQRPGENFAYVTARPVSQLERDQEVLLVWNQVFAEVAEAADIEEGQQ